MYIDGFIAAVPRDRRSEYDAFARRSWGLFERFGALRQVETWGDDVPDGKLTDLRRAVAAEDHEEVVFSWLEWPDESTRQAAFMEMEAGNAEMGEMPFDGQRMIFGGFVPVLDLGESTEAPAYVDGFVLAVPTAKRDAFIAHATKGDSVFMEAGAHRIVEAWGDDVPAGKRTDLARAVKAESDETVCFSWIEWPDKATRDAAFARMQEAMSDPEKMDPRLDPQKNPMPFDGKRMIWGGFVPMFEFQNAGG